MSVCNSWNLRFDIIPIFPSSSKEQMMRIIPIVLSLIFLNNSFGDQPPQPIATIPFQSVDKLIFLPVQVNGSAPLWFVLDSGASGCVIEKKSAEKLGLKTAGAEQRQGAGAGKINVTFAKDIRFSLRGLNAFLLHM